MDDVQIIDLFWARSESAIGELGDKYGRLAESVASNILNNRMDTEECMNDSYLGMWRSLPPNRPAVLPAYFVALTRNVALKLYRHSSAAKRSAVMQELGDLTDSAPSPEEQINEAGRIISDFLGGVDKQSRVLFMRRYYLGEPMAEAAKAVGLSENAAAVRLSRMRKRLKIKLESEGIPV